MEDPGGAEKFERGGWTWPYWNDEIGKFKADELFSSDALLLGRVTYQGFAAAWPSRSDESGFADRMNSLPKFVFSTTLKKLEWNNSRLLTGKIVDEVSRLKEQYGHDILTAGSGHLVRMLMHHDLVDEYRLLVYPVVLGSGKRLFQGVGDLTLSLVGTKSFNSGVVLLPYRPVEKGAEKGRRASRPT